MVSVARRGLPVLVVLLLLGACGRSHGTGAKTGTGSPAVSSAAASAAPTTDAPASGPPPGAGVTTSPGGSGGGTTCAADDLDVKLGEPSSAKFEEVTVLSLVNRGAATCSVTGYPRLSFTSDGRVLPINVVQDADKVSAVAIRPGGAAESVLRWNKYEGQGSTCQPFPTHVTVTPPGRTVVWFVDPLSASVCGGKVHARPFTARA